MHLVVMGVSGSGKTTLASALALRLGWTFADADSFHSPANVAKMTAGLPLEDADRSPWLDAISAWLEARRDENVVLAMSALKREYRDRFRGAQFVYLRVPREVLATRLAGRVGHFFSAALLDSQLSVFEEPKDDEHVLMVDGTRSPEALVEEVVALLRLR